MTITAIPPLDRTSSTFRDEVDTMFSTRIPTLTVELNTLAADVTLKQGLASAAAISTNNDKIATAADRVQTGLDRVQTGQDRAAAAASAATIGVTAAFSDANPMIKNAVDNSKMGKFKANLITPGVMREWEMPDRNGKVALLDDTALVLLASVVPVDNALTIDFLNVFSPAYDNYLIKIRTMEGSIATGDFVRLRFAVAGVVDSNARYSWASNNTSTSDTGVNADTSGRVLGNIYTASLSGEINVLNANGTNTSKAWHSIGVLNGATGWPTRDTSWGFYNGASAISGFRLFVSGAYAKFLAKGSIEVYGYKKVM